MDDARHLASEIAALKRAVRDIQLAAQLGSSSIEDGTTEVYDVDGNLRQVIGQQDDGTFTTVDLNAPAPVAPSAPVVTPRPGVLVIAWNGQLSDGSALPRDFARVEVHLGATPGFTADDTTQIASLVSPFGGALTHAVDPSEHYVKLVAVNTSGTESVPSAEVAATPLAIVAPGGVKTYSDPTAPTGLTTDDEGSIWFNESNRNEPNRWDGTQWLVVSNPDALIANDIYGHEGYFGTIGSEQINTGNLNATLALIGALLVGAAISIDGDNGIVINTPVGQTRFAADGSGNTLAGDMLAQSLTVLGQLAIRGTTNEISKGSRVVMSTGTTAPQSAPVISATWDNKVAQSEYNPRGLVAFGTNYLVAGSLFNGYVNRLHENTSTFDTLGDGFDITNDFGRSEVVNALGGLTVVGSTVYVLCQTNEAIPGSFNSRWYVYKFNEPTPGTWAYLGRFLYEPTTGLGGNSSFQPAIGTDGTNLLIVQCGAGFGDVNLSTYSTAGTLLDRFPLKQADGSNWSPNRDMASVAKGSFDFGGSRYVASAQGLSTAYSFDPTSHLNQPNESFPTPSGANGLMWDASLGIFRSYVGADDATGSSIYDHTDIVGTSPVHVVTGWRKSDGTSPDFALYETAKSPTATYENFPRRKQLTVSTNPIPDDGGDSSDADSISVYVSRVTTPTNSDFHRVATPAVGVTQVDLETLVLTGGAPPLTSTFPAASPALFQSADFDADGPLIDLRGDGYARIAELLLTAGRSITRVDFGMFTGTTDSTGNLSIPHTLGVEPVTVLFTGGNNATRLYFERGGNTTSTVIGLQVRDDTGANVASASVDVNWLAIS